MNKNTYEVEIKWEKIGKIDVIASNEEELKEILKRDQQEIFLPENGQEVEHSIKILNYKEKE